MEGVPRGLLTPPDGLLSNVVASLDPVDLRRLNHVNHRLLDFVFEYSRPSVTGLTALPNEFALGVIAHLADDDRSRLARTSYRFYPLVMDAILCRDIRTQRNKLLKFAMIKSRKGLARRLLQRGADVETRFRCTFAWTDITPLSFAAYHGHLEMVRLLSADVHAESDFPWGRVDMGNLCKSPTALHLAAYHGHQGIVDLLLRAGARQIFEQKPWILCIAISRYHDQTILQLLEAFNSTDKLSGSGMKDLLQLASSEQVPPFSSFSSRVLQKYDQVVLQRLQPLASIKDLSEDTVAGVMQRAVAGKLAGVVEYLAQIRERRKFSETTLDSALYLIISSDACKDNMGKKEVHQEVYQIVNTLLAHCADPDAHACEYSDSQPTTAREIATMHPDNRMRDRLAKALRPCRPTKQPLVQVGRSWMMSEAPPKFVTPQLQWKPSPSFWDFLEPFDVREKPQANPPPPPPPPLQSYPQLASSIIGSLPPTNRV